MEIVGELIKEGADITAFDPKAMPTAKHLVGDQIKYATSPLEAAKDADVLAILTEWPEFKQESVKDIANVMKGRQIVDCRNLIKREDAEAEGFSYLGIGC